MYMFAFLNYVFHTTKSCSHTESSVCGTYILSKNLLPHIHISKGSHAKQSKKNVWGRNFLCMRRCTIIIIIFIVYAPSIAPAPPQKKETKKTQTCMHASVKGGSCFAKIYDLYIWCLFISFTYVRTYNFVAPLPM